MRTVGMVEREQAMRGHGVGRSPSQSGHFEVEDDNIDKYGSQHRIFHWISMDSGKENEEVHPHEVVDNHGIPQGVLLEHIEDEIEEESAMLSLPPALWLVLVYVLLLTYHDRASLVRDIEASINFDIEENANFAFSSPGYMGHKSVYDMNSHADFHSFLRVGIRPLLLSYRKAMPEDYDASILPPELLKDARKMYLNGFNRLVGGVRMLQEHAAEESVPDEELEHFHGKNICPARQGMYPSVVNHRDKPTRYEVLMSEPAFDPAMTQWLMLSADEDELDSILEKVDAEGWMNERVVEAELNFLVYNAYFDTLTYIAVRISQSRSGHLWRSITHDTLFMRVYGSGSTTVLLIIIDTVFLLQVFYIFVYEVYDVFHHARLQIRTGHGFVHFIQDYVGVWNMVDWIFIAFSFAIVIMFIEHCILVQDIRALLVDVGGQDKPDQEILDDLFDSQKSASRQFIHLKFLSALYAIVVILRLFKAFSAQPRMALVTRTLVGAATDVLHFGIVFATIFFSYTILGMVLFGRNIANFSELDRAWDTVFLIIMGDFDISEMAQSGRSMAAIYFSSFIFLIVLIMLNMLMALIMDAYTNAQASISSDEETIWAEAYQFVRRWRDKRRGLRVSLSHIHECYTKKFGRPPREVLKRREKCLQTLITVDQFRQDVESLGVAQAHRLMVGATHSFKATIEMTQPLGLANAMSVISKIHSKLDGFIYDCSEKREQRRKASISANQKHWHVVGSAVLLGGPAHPNTASDNVPDASAVQWVSPSGQSDPHAATAGKGTPETTLSPGSLRSDEDDTEKEAGRLSQTHDCETLLAAVVCRLSSLTVTHSKTREHQILLAFAYHVMETYMDYKQRNSSMKEGFSRVLEMDSPYVEMRDEVDIPEDGGHCRTFLDNCASCRLACSRQPSVGLGAPIAVGELREDMSEALPGLAAEDKVARSAYL